MAHAIRSEPRSRDRSTTAGMERTWSVHPRDIWHDLKGLPLSFWLVCGYLFFEYVRPASLYPELAFLPWTQLTILGCAAALVLERNKLRLPLGLSGLHLAFIGIVLLSGLTAWRPDISWSMISLPLSWFLIYLLIVNSVTTERRFFIFLLSFLLYSFKMSQHGARSWASIGFGFRRWGATGGPGWFHNSGEFGIQMCVFFPLAVAFVIALRRYWGRLALGFFILMPITAVMSIIASASRGALIGLAVVLAWMVAQTKYRFRAAAGAVLLGVVAFNFIPEQQMERLQAMGEDNTSVHRLQMWEDGIEIANEHPLLGIGYNNWRPYYMSYYDHGLPHNIFIQAWAELGYVGLLAFLALIGGTFYTNARTRRIGRRLRTRGRFLYWMGWGLDGALVGYVASGFFVTVLYYPYFWINLAMTVSLHLAARHTLKEVRQAEVRREGMAGGEARPPSQRIGPGQSPPGELIGAGG